MSRSHLTTLALAAAALACGDSSAPTPLPVEQITVSICADEVWFAYQNEGGAWTRGVPVGGVVTFDATDKVTVAIASVRSILSNVTVLQFTSAQLDAMTCPTSAPAGTKTLSGAVAGLTGENFAEFAVGDAGSMAFANGDYSVTNVRSGPLDLVAAR